MSDEFCKSTRGIDRKIQSRVFEAMLQISRDPITSKGDTVQPLASGMKGLWRYRIGDFRLIYCPDTGKRHVTLLEFGSRGSAYE